MSLSVSADVAGTYRVRLTLTDSTGLSVTEVSEAIVAGPCGANAPTVGASGVVESTLSPAVGGTVSLSAPDASDADSTCGAPFTESLAYSWSFEERPAGSAAVLSVTGASMTSFVADVAGTYRVRLTLTDSTGLSVTEVSEAIVAGPCGANAPVALISEIVPATAGPSTALVAADACLGRTVQVTAASSTDADMTGPCSLAESLTYRWRFLELPLGSNASVNDDQIVNPWFDVNDTGRYVLGLLVTDSTGRSSTATFTITGDPASCVIVAGGFSITTIAAGGLFDQPQGIAKDASGNIYVAQFNAGSILRVNSSGNVVTFAAGGFLNAPRDLAFDAGTSTLFASAGGGRIVKLSTLGVQTSCLSGGGADYNGIQLYTGTMGLRLVAADESQNRVAFINPGACTLATTNDFAGNLGGRPWGVAAAVVAAADHVFATDPGNQEIWRNVGGAYVTNAGAEVQISNDGRLDELRDIVTTPCATPKLLVADRNRGEIFLFTNAASAPLGIFASGLNAPVGLFFEDANNLLVTDENTNALFRITGDFCTL